MDYSQGKKIMMTIGTDRTIKVSLLEIYIVFPKETNLLNLGEKVQGQKKKVLYMIM
jgi:hypothetical protein